MFFHKVRNPVFYKKRNPCHVMKTKCRQTNSMKKIIVPIILKSSKPFQEHVIPRPKEIEYSNEFFLSKRTKLHYYLTKSGHSSKQEWLEIQNCPVRVIKKDDLVELNSFHSKRNFKISTNDFENDFIPIEEKNGFLYISSYPFPISINEFEKRNNVDKKF